MTAFRSARVAALAAIAAVSMTAPSFGQAYPEKAITYIVPSSAGSAVDTLARIVTDGMSKVLGQAVVVDDRPGAGGNVGAAIAAEARPDGYTVMQANNNHAANVTLYAGELTYDLTADFIPVTRLALSPYVFVVNPSLDVNTLEDLIALAKEKPGEVTYASAGVGSGTFMVTELFKSQAGLDLLHVPYNGGGPALNSVVAGETMVYGAPLAVALPFLEDGKLRGLAVTSPERVPGLDYPAAAEFVPGYEFTAWAGIMVPKGTPEEVGTTLRDAAREALADETVKQRLTDLGYVPLGDSSEEFAAALQNEIDKMAKLIKDNNLKPQ